VDKPTHIVNQIVVLSVHMLAVLSKVLQGLSYFFHIYAVIVTSSKPKLISSKYLLVK